MTAALTLKSTPNLLAYDWLCDSAGEVSATRTRAELIADCEARDLPAYKRAFEQATTDEAWAALASKLAPTVIPGFYSRVQLTAKFESVDGAQRMTIAGKSWGVSKAAIEVRPK